MLDKLDELFPSWAQNHTDHCRSEIYESADTAEEERMVVIAHATLLRLYIRLLYIVRTFSCAVFTTIRLFLLLHPCLLARPCLYDHHQLIEQRRRPLFHAFQFTGFIGKMDHHLQLIGFFL